MKLALAGAALTALLGSVTSAILLLDARHARPVPLLGGRLARRPRRRRSPPRSLPFLVVGTRAGPRRRPARSTPWPSATTWPARSASGSRWPGRVAAARRSCSCAAPRPRPPGRSPSSASPCPTSPAPSPGPTTAGCCRTRWCSAPILLLGADVIGRVIARPGELQVGIVTAVVGAPSSSPSSAAASWPSCDVAAAAPLGRPAGSTGSSSCASPRLGLVDPGARPGRRGASRCSASPSPCSRWSLAVGDFPIPLGDVLATLVGRRRRPTAEFIVRTLRLPRALTARARRRRLRAVRRDLPAPRPQPAGQPRHHRRQRRARRPPRCSCIVVLARARRPGDRRRPSSARSSPSLADLPRWPTSGA